MKTIKFAADIKKTEFPFVTVTDGAFSGLSFMLDTGSNNNVLFDEGYRRVKDHLKMTGMWTDLGGLGGTRRVPVAEGHIVFAGQDHRVHFVLGGKCDIATAMQRQTGLVFAGIMGTKFMIANRWTIDLTAQEVHVRPLIILPCAS